MKHARDDYDRIQDPAGLIPEDEPVFLLRAQDPLAARLVVDWAIRYMIQKNPNPAMAATAIEHAKKMEQWTVKKVADLPKPDTTEVSRTVSVPGRGVIEGEKVG